MSAIWILIAACLVTTLTAIERASYWRRVARAYRDKAAELDRRLFDALLAGRRTDSGSDPS